MHSPHIDIQRKIIDKFTTLFPPALAYVTFYSDIGYDALKVTSEGILAGVVDDDDEG